MNWTAKVHKSDEITVVLEPKCYGWILAYAINKWIGDSLVKCPLNERPAQNHKTE
jgi:hypothetical protein